MLHWKLLQLYARRNYKYYNNIKGTWKIFNFHSTNEFSLVTFLPYQPILIFNQDKTELKDYCTPGSCLTSNLKYNTDMERIASTEEIEHNIVWI